MPDHLNTKTKRRGEPVEPASPYVRLFEIDEPVDAHLTDDETLLLGRYSVIETRATGGFGYVEVCWDTRLQRRVAIKCIPLVSLDTNAQATSAADAIQEARVACMLAHPNIVTVFDFESDNVYAYIVMEYVNGLSLGELLQRVEGGTLTYDEAAYVLDSVASALAFAHENGVLHMDIKPSNILIDRAGTVKLSDFGMATLASAAGYGGARGGTVGYMPPEQIVGDLVDERCDVFALATVLWQAMTGENPFAARTAGESLDRIRRGVEGRLSDTCAGVGDVVDTIMDDALSPDPSRRIASVSTFAEVLVPELGEPDEGHQTITALLDQLSSDESGLPDRRFPRPPKPILQRARWLEPAVARILTAICCAIMAHGTFTPLFGLMPDGDVFVPLICALAAAVWSQLGGLVLAIGTVASFCVAAQSAPEPAVGTALGITLGMVLGLWWIAAGRMSSVGTTSMFAGPALGVPIASPSLSAIAHPPLSATLVCMLSFFLTHMLPAARDAGFAASATMAAMGETCAHPSFWIGLAGVGAAGCAASALSRFDSVPLAVVGQVVGVGILFGAAGLATGVENGGIWTMPTWSTLVVAVTLAVFLSLAQAAFGPPEVDREEE